VDIFAEAAISKEYLPAEGSSRAIEWVSLGMLSDEDTAARRFNPCEDSVFVARISFLADVGEAARPEPKYLFSFNKPISRW